MFLDDVDTYTRLLLTPSVPVVPDQVADPEPRPGPAEPPRARQVVRLGRGDLCRVLLASLSAEDRRLVWQAVDRHRRAVAEALARGEDYPEAMI